MGLLKVGRPLPWKDTLPHCQYIREHGIRQFLATWARVKDLQNDRLFYGDEIEYAILRVDPATRTVRISLRGLQVMEELTRREQNTEQQLFGGCTWHPEYGSWMVEGTPAVPYGGYTNSLLQVEQNMRLRRARLLSALAPNEIAPTVVNFPMMGAGDYVDPPSSPGGDASNSTLISDRCINPHPRFATLTANIRARRGSKVDIRVPLFKDKLTPPEENCIEMDCMAFGMGCCCLQVTFQCSDVDESRYMYDQLATLAPIMLALTAATPIFRGRLADVDARWQAISASVDDRTPAERGEVEGRRIHKSRYDSVSCYISRLANADEETRGYLNNVPCEVDDDIKAVLEAHGLEGPLARHLAHLFVRDPLVAFAGSVGEVKDDASLDLFEGINSTNWQTVRWKPPPVPQSRGAPHIGWRTEFRAMEVQLTDFENAAFTAFVVLLTRALLVFDLDLLIPLSRVDENMNRAHVPDAVGRCKFWFRKDIVRGGKPPSTAKGAAFKEMRMHEIVNGKEGAFLGLVPLCFMYLEHIGCDPASLARITEYLTLISKRAAGKSLTPATWMRRFVAGHGEYRQDSVITPGIAHDLMVACHEIGLGTRACPELLGGVVVEPIKVVGAFGTPLSSTAAAGARRGSRSELRRKLYREALTARCSRSQPMAVPLRSRISQRLHSIGKESACDADGRGGGGPCCFAWLYCALCQAGLQVRKSIAARDRKKNGA